MTDLIVKIGIVFVILIGIYYIYRKVKKKIMINRDYNRKLNDGDLKLRNDLAVLRKELLKTDNPNLRNEILNKIDVMVKDRKGGYEK
jgi:hypothetical protein